MTVQTALMLVAAVVARPFGAPAGNVFLALSKGFAFVLALLNVVDDDVEQAVEVVTSLASAFCTLEVSIGLVFAALAVPGHVRGVLYGLSSEGGQEAGRRGSSGGSVEMDQLFLTEDPPATLAAHQRSAGQRHPDTSTTTSSSNSRTVNLIARNASHAQGMDREGQAGDVNVDVAAPRERRVGTLISERAGTGEHPSDDDDDSNERQHSGNWYENTGQVLAMLLIHHKGEAVARPVGPLRHLVMAAAGICSFEDKKDAVVEWRRAGSGPTLPNGT